MGAFLFRKEAKNVGKSFINKNMNGYTLINVGPNNATIDGSAVGTVTSVNSKEPTSGAVTIVASDITITDASSNFTTDTVQGAIDQLFTFANSGKTQVAAAIGGTATSDNTFAELATQITSLKDNISINGAAIKSVMLDENVSKFDILKSSYRTFTPAKLVNFTAPTGTQTRANAVAWSNNNFVAIGTSATPWHAVYQANGDTITKLADLASMIGIATNGVALSSDATYLAFAQNSSSTSLSIYKRSGLSFTRLTNPVQPASSSRCLAFSPSDEFLAVGSNTTPFVEVYQRSTDTFTKVTSTMTQPTADVASVAWSADNSYLMVGYLTNAPYLNIYNRSGTTFTLMTLTGGNPTGQVFGVAVSPDGTLFAAAHTSAPYITMYQRSGNTFTKLSDSFDFNPGANATSIAWSPDGMNLIVGTVSGSNYVLYKRRGTSFTRLAPAQTPPTGQTNGVAFNPNQNYFAAAHSTTPFISIYRNDSFEYLYTKISSASLTNISSFDKVVGVALANGSAGSSIQASILVGGGL